MSITADDVVLLEAATNAQGDLVRALKADLKAGKPGITKEDVTAAVEVLKERKASLAALLKDLQAQGGATGVVNKEETRRILNDALERRLFVVPSFRIYGGVSGLFDLGPPGCAIKANLLAFWRQHFVVNESMLEVECPAVTPEPVLKASGHVDRFTDLMVTDTVTNEPFRADHLLEDALEKIMEDPKESAERKKEALNLKTIIDELDEKQLGEQLKNYNITAPETGNPISDPYPFNLMFATQIGPSGYMKGFLRPETAQGIFTNFRDLYYFNGGKLPFAAAQIGESYRNEISPKAGLLRVRQFTQAEIEHFVNPSDKAHHKFKEVANVELSLYGREQQMGESKKPVKKTMKAAVDEGMINNETLAYYMARTHLFLEAIGVDIRRLRFRQHLTHEMAHYACDCWDAEIECSYGWTECVGIADRSAFDLKAHAVASKTDLDAFEAYAKPVVVEKLEAAPNKQLIGKALKGDGKIAMEVMATMSQEGLAKLQSDLASGGASITLPDGRAVALESAWVVVKTVQKKETGRNFTPGVIEPSFGIGRIMYCMWEHCLYTRDGDDQKIVFRFTPLSAPIKCTVFPLLNKDAYNDFATALGTELSVGGISNTLDTTGVSIGKKYARTDELGVPFAVTVDGQTLEDKSVTMRERDSTKQIRVPSKDVVGILQKLCALRSTFTWKDALAKYPAQEAGGGDKEPSSSSDAEKKDKRANKPAKNANADSKPKVEGIPADRFNHVSWEGSLFAKPA